MDFDSSELEEGPGRPPLQIVQRVGSLPVVMSAMEQLGALYGYTKEANSFVKFGLETAETGLKKSSEMAIPVVSRFEKPVSKLDSFAVGQLEKFEHHLPIITKPVPQVKDEAHKLYDATLRPTVDRLSSVTKYGVDTVTSVKDKGVSTVNGVKTYTSEKVQDVATYTSDKVQGVATYTSDTIHHVAEANKKGVQQVASYSGEKVNQLLETRAGQYVHEKVDNVLTGTEAYVDYYLPEDQKEAEVQMMEVQEQAPTPVSATVSKVRRLSRKASCRVYSHGKARLDNIIVRSAEAIGKLNFTVDLMEYAKTHLDNGKTAVQNGLVKSKDKVWSVWEQVTQTESDTDSPDVNKLTMQSRLVATARHLASSLKQSYDSLPSATRLMPESVRSIASTARGKIDEIYQSFAGMTNLNDVSTATLTRVRTLLGNVQSLSATLLSYSASYLPFLKPTVSDPALEMEKVPLNADEEPSEELAEKPTAPEETKAEPEKPDCPNETEKPKLVKEDLNDEEENPE